MVLEEDKTLKRKCDEVDLYVQQRVRDDAIGCVSATREKSLLEFR